MSTTPQTVLRPGASPLQWPFKQWLPLLVVGWGVSALIFIGLLTYGIAADVGFELRYDSLFLPFGLAIVFVAFSRISDTWISPCLILLSTILCGSVLSGVWSSAVSDLSLMAGLFPNSDSFSYVSGSFSLVQNGELSPVGSRRPLAPALGASLLYLCQGNLRGLLALTVFLVAITLTRPVREIIRTHGWVAGYGMFLILFLFYRRFIGTALSEHVGLALGCLAFAMLWKAAYNRRTVMAMSGIFFLTLALCARAGAFFVIPALVFWGSLTWRSISRFSTHIFMSFCIAAAMGFAVNAVVLYTTGTPKAAAGNFSYSLYGVVHGGDWTQVLHDHPEVRHLEEVERNSAIYDLVMTRLKERPSSLVTGAFRSFRQMLFSNEGPYSFVLFALQRSIREIESPTAEPATEGIVNNFTAHPWKFLQITATYVSFLGISLFALVGIVVLARRRHPVSALLFWTLAGIFLSAPFAPPWDADLMRVYAATIPFMIAIPSIGFSTLTARLSLHRHVERGCECNAASVTGGRRCLVFVFVIISLSCVFPCYFALRASWSPDLPEIDPNQITPRLIRLVPGSDVWFTSDASTASKQEAVGIETIHRNMGVLAETTPDRAEELKAALLKGKALAMGYDVNARLLRHLVLDETIITMGSHKPVWLELEPVLPGEKETIWWKGRLFPYTNRTHSEKKNGVNQ